RFSRDWSSDVCSSDLYVPPPRPTLVPRRRLLERLEAGATRKLTLVSAPAGFGKTTVVSTWIATRQHPAAWLSLDAQDHDVARFLDRKSGVEGKGVELG